MFCEHCCNFGCNCCVAIVAASILQLLFCKSVGSTGCFCEHISRSPPGATATKNIKNMHWRELHGIPTSREYTGVLSKTIQNPVVYDYHWGIKQTNASLYSFWIGCSLSCLAFLDFLFGGSGSSSFKKNHPSETVYTPYMTWPAMQIQAYIGSHEQDQQRHSDSNEVRNARR